MNDKQLEKLCIWCGPAAATVFFAGQFLLARLIPPPINPLTPVAEIVAFYSDNRTGILLGEILILWGTALMIPFMLALFAHLKRTERGFPYCSAIYLFCAVIVVMEIIVPAWNFTTAAFRPDRPPEITHALSDQAWLMYVWPNPQTIVMTLAVGVAILRDQSAAPLFPRWLGFFNLAGATLYAGSTFANMLYSGPFSWAGLMSFWIPAFDFGNWFLLMFFALLKATKRDDYELAREPA